MSPASHAGRQISCGLLVSLLLAVLTSATLLPGATGQLPADKTDVQCL